MKNFIMEIGKLDMEVRFIEGDYCEYELKEEDCCEDEEKRVDFCEYEEKKGDFCDFEEKGDFCEYEEKKVKDLSFVFGSLKVKGYMFKKYGGG